MGIPVEYSSFDPYSPLYSSLKSKGFLTIESNVLTKCKKSIMHFLFSINQIQTLQSFEKSFSFCVVEVAHPTNVFLLI